jgi:hypothetical protein
VRFLIAVPIFLLAGCIAEPKAATLDVAGHTHDHMMSLPTLGASKCVQAGGNSLYPMTGPALPGGMGGAARDKVGPFHAADQRPEVGNPMIGAYGTPILGPQSGIWHVGVVCDSYTYNGTVHPGFKMGWIAQMIQKPDFDTSDARLHFMVADLSFNELGFVDELRDHTMGAEVSPNKQTMVEWMVPDKYMHVVISEASHGTFDFTAELHKDLGKKQTEHIRFWMLVATDGSHHDHGGRSAPAAKQYRPIAIDVFDTADGTGKRLAGESVGTFTHIQDLSKPANNHAGNPLGHYQDGFSRTITLVHDAAPEGLVYNETWLH